MYMALISGWEDTIAFAEDEEKAKKLAVKYKKKYCKDDLEKWNWGECEDYYGACTYNIKDGTVIFDNEVIK